MRKRCHPDFSDRSKSQDDPIFAHTNYEAQCASSVILADDTLHDASPGFSALTDGGALSRRFEVTSRWTAQRQRLLLSANAYCSAPTLAEAIFVHKPLRN